MFTIKNHLLYKDGKQVPFKKSANVGGVIKPTILVMHFTGGGAEGAINTLITPRGKSSVSAHLVLKEDGSVVQLVPFNVKAWHAGASQWGSNKAINSSSIGIEMVNYGPLKKMADGNYKTEIGGKVIKPAGVVVAGHKNNPKVVIGWDDFPAAQIDASIEIMRAIVEAYGIKENNVVGHDDIAPRRKLDPGPAYPLARVKSRAFGRAA